MGKGGYSGGSTIVGGFGWSSFDPAAPGRKVTKQKNRRGGAITGQQPAKAKRPPNLNALRLIYLDAIIDAALRSQPAPMPPRHARVELSAATEKAGGPIAWARAQPEFAVVLEKRQKKLAGKQGQPVRAVGAVRLAAITVETTVPNANVKTRQANAISTEALCKERARLGIALADAEKLAREFRASIAQIDRQLALRNPSRK